VRLFDGKGSQDLKHTILVVDDEDDIVEMVRYNLTKEGYDVVGASNGEDAIRMAKKAAPDLIILDLMLPGVDGLDVCRVLKNDDRTNHIPIIMLTAKGEETDIVLGLELGADDYITKPFSLKVLRARVKAVIRRTKSTDNDRDDTVIQLRGLTIDPERHQLKIDDKSIDLTATEFRILYFLAHKPGWVFTRSQIVDAVRGEDYPVTDRTIDVHIVSLRKKLGEYGTYISTVRGVGYRFLEE
jgi:two-component system alkaline phosphatase synthesis response regulator PhoP